MVREAAHRHGASGPNIIRLGRHIYAGAGNLGFAFQFLECQLELFDLGNQLLRGPPETHPLELGKLETQRLDQRVAGRQSSFKLGDPGVFVDAGNSLIRHPDLLADQGVPCQKNLGKSVRFLPRQKGRYGPLRTPPVDAFQQHRKLRRCEAHLARLRHRPDELAPVHPFGKQA